MSNRDRESVGIEDLVAWAEGRIPAGLPLYDKIARHLADHPEDASRVQAYIRQDAAIRHAWQGVAQEPVPARLLPDHLRARRSHPHPSAWPSALAASVVIAATAGWMLGRADLPAEPAAGEQFAEQVLGSYSTPIATPAQADGITAIAVDGVPPPQLAGMQFIAEESDGKLQRFQYSGPDGEPLQLYISPAETDETALRSVTSDGFNLVYWQQGAAFYALGSPMEPGRLESLALGAMAEIAGGTPPTSIQDVPLPQADEGLEFDLIPRDLIPEAAVREELPVTRLEVMPLDTGDSL